MQFRRFEIQFGCPHHAGLNLILFDCPFNFRFKPPKKTNTDLTGQVLVKRFAPLPKMLPLALWPQRARWGRDKHLY